MSQEQPRNEKTLPDLTKELVKELTLPGDSAWKTEKLLPSIATFALTGKETEAQNILNQYYHIDKVPEETQTLIQETIALFLKKNKELLEHINTQEIETQQEARRKLAETKTRAIKKEELVIPTQPTEPETENSTETEIAETQEEIEHINRDHPRLTASAEQIRNSAPKKVKRVYRGKKHRNRKEKTEYTLSEEVKAYFDAQPEVQEANKKLQEEERKTLENSSKLIDSLFPEHTGKNEEEVSAPFDTHIQTTPHITAGVAPQEPGFSTTHSTFNEAPPTLGTLRGQGARTMIYDGQGDSIPGYKKVRTGPDRYAYKSLFKTQNPQEIHQAEENQLLGLGWNTKDISYMDENLRKQIIADQKRKPNEKGEEDKNNTQEKTHSQIAEEMLVIIPNWKEQDISITEDAGYVTFSFKDKKYQAVSKLQIPITQTEKITALRTLLTPYTGDTTLHAEKNEGSEQKTEQGIYTFADPEGKRKELLTLQYPPSVIEILTATEIKDILANNDKHKRPYLTSYEKDYAERIKQHKIAKLKNELAKEYEEKTTRQRELAEIRATIKAYEERQKTTQATEETETRGEPEKISPSIEHSTKDILKENKKIHLEQLRSQLEKELPDSQMNTRTEATRKLIAFAEEVYNQKFEGDIEKGEYISWLQSLGDAGYYASQYLNAPKIALEKLSQSEHYKYLTR